MVKRMKNYDKEDAYAPLWRALLENLRPKNYNLLITRTL